MMKIPFSKILSKQNPFPTNTALISHNFILIHHPIPPHHRTPLISTACVESSSPVPATSTSPTEPHNYQALISTKSQRRCARQGGNKGSSALERKTTNPFLVFFLRLRSRKPGVASAKLARIAGCRWQQMTVEQRQKYVDLADAEKRRRKEGCRRDCRSRRSRGR